MLSKSLTWTSKNSVFRTKLILLDISNSMIHPTISLMCFTHVSFNGKKVCYCLFQSGMSVSPSLLLHLEKRPYTCTHPLLTARVLIMRC